MLGRIEPSKSPMFTATGTLGRMGRLISPPPGGGENLPPFTCRAGLSRHSLGGGGSQTKAGSPASGSPAYGHLQLSTLKKPVPAPARFRPSRGHHAPNRGKRHQKFFPQSRSPSVSVFRLAAAIFAWFVCFAGRRSGLSTTCRAKIR